MKRAYEATKFGVPQTYGQISDSLDIPVDQQIEMKQQLYGFNMSNWVHMPQTVLFDWELSVLNKAAEVINGNGDVTDVTSNNWILEWLYDLFSLSAWLP